MSAKAHGLSESTMCKSGGVFAMIVVVKQKGAELAIPPIVKSSGRKIELTKNASAGFPVP